MESSVIETVAKYFYFSSLDEQASFSASLKALSELKANNWLSGENRPRWVEVLSRWRSKVSHLRPKPWTALGNDPGFTVPADFDLVGWTRFRAGGDGSEVEAVLLSKILGFSDEEIASGLGVTVGTVRYRVGRGLRHLGGYLGS